MEPFTKQLSTDLKVALADLQQAFPFTEDSLLVVGASTSEVIGAQIGSKGSEAVADTIFQVLAEIRARTNVQLAFQCCEHLNRALVVERKTARDRRYEIVSAIPIRTAGGAMATHAFGQLDDPVLVETIQAEMGIDIGDTFIGMHLRPVAVPLRSTVKEIGQAHVTMAYTRPRLIGGIRAVYHE
ncbi:TIGR01440 family protein [Halalkalibacter sp. APA_J-10(15)]|uniref:TIGR01440 family protein n=1 Tax=Halalkalibacter sp. APA_J-10(15) TaxID=2933805 RepID=UPI001FF6F90F|nr:TIGR01440 family protein [Halalkalibacter sp. APA_J-10(15)]MCK0470038.1 TIGR01440 family protein [Halalkalibacter sp. APA_J-10(15)]